MQLSYIENLLLNMSGGLKPEDLNEHERKILEAELGKDWLLKLGYQTNLEYLEMKSRETEDKKDL
jgi:hypothetical protein